MSIEQFYQVSLDTTINSEEYDFAKFGNKFESWELNYICKAITKDNFLDYFMMIIIPSKRLTLLIAQEVTRTEKMVL